MFISINFCIYFLCLEFCGRILILKWFWVSLHLIFKSLLQHMKDFKVVLNIVVFIQHRIPMGTARKGTEEWGGLPCPWQRPGPVSAIRHVRSVLLLYWCFCIMLISWRHSSVTCDATDCLTLRSKGMHPREIGPGTKEFSGSQVIPGSPPLHTKGLLS